MSEMCDSKAAHFSSLLMSDLLLLCSFCLSHPLYFSYFIFFSPYLVRLVSFLSPLFITTFLVCLAFLTSLVHDSLSSELGQSRVSFLVIAYASVVEKLRSKSKKDCEGQDGQCLEDLGMYEVLFGEVKESPIEVLEGGSDSEDLSIGETEVVPDDVKVEMSPEVDSTCGGMEDRRLENFLKILNEFERMASSVEERKRAEPSRGAKADKVIEKQKVMSLVGSGSEAVVGKINGAAKVSVSSSNGEKDGTLMVQVCHQRISPKVDDHVVVKSMSKIDCVDGNCGHDDAEDESSSSYGALDDHSLGTYGSMRKEKEWKRTLACKLFEERHNVDGGEGMDSLWEAYEMDSDKSMKHKNGKQKEKEKKKTKSKSKTKQEVEYYGNEEEEEVDGQLCCVQAFKLSAGKMNMGMGRPNLVKITKAIKGIGWLHHVSKHSKKVHNSGDRY